MSKSTDTDSSTAFQNSSIEHLLRKVLELIRYSKPFHYGGQDVHSRFWMAYENVANEYDTEFLERYNADLDALLIFACLFSAVSSAFIVQFEPDLEPDPTDTTNALLKILIHSMDPSIFANDNLALPKWTGPSPVVIWIQCLAYASLSTSLLSAFGAVLGKQWLSNFKTSRFGRGALEDRCKWRQKKLHEMQKWRVSRILDVLPVLLQFSLLLFAVALATDLWFQEKIIGAVLIAATSMGISYYLVKFFLLVIYSRSSFGYSLSQSLVEALQNSRRSSRRSFLMRILTSCTSLLFNIYYSFHRSSRTVYQSADPNISSIKLLQRDFSLDNWEAWSIKWLLETSTDPDIISAAAEMVPMVEWPANFDVTVMCEQLEYSCHQCLAELPYLRPQTDNRAVSYLKALSHLYLKRTVLKGAGRFALIWGKYSGLTTKLSPSHPIRLVFAMTAALLGEPADLRKMDISDYTWFCHHLPHAIHMRTKAHLNIPEMYYDILQKSLQECTFPASVAADSLLSLCILLGESVPPDIFNQIDKSPLIPHFRNILFKSLHRQIRAEGLVLHLENHQKAVERLKVAIPLSYYLEGTVEENNTDATYLSQWALGLFFFFTSDEGTTTNSQYARVGEVLGSIDWDQLARASMRIALLTLPRRTSEQYADLVWRLPRTFMNCPEPYTVKGIANYLRYLRQKGDHTAIGDAFLAVSSLTYMGQADGFHDFLRALNETVELPLPSILRNAALKACWSLRTCLVFCAPGVKNEVRAIVSRVGSFDQSDESDPGLSEDWPTYNEERDRCYLRLISTLCRNPLWHAELRDDGHFTRSLQILKRKQSEKKTRSKSSRMPDHAINLIEILTAMASLQVDTHLERTEGKWSNNLILQAWDIISIDLQPWMETSFVGLDWDGWSILTTTGCLDSLPALVTFTEQAIKDGIVVDLLLLRQRVDKTREFLTRNVADPKLINEISSLKNLLIDK